MRESSKMDGLRAMREARFEARPGQQPKRPAKVDEPTLCGHRSISGRSCTRELGHASKTHRYS